MLFIVILSTSIAAFTISAAGRYVAQKTFHPTILKTERETITVMFGTIGLIYSLILAFALVGVWEDYEDLHTTVRKEATIIHRTARHSTVTDPISKQELAVAMDKYRQVICGPEWSSVSGNNSKSTAILQDLRQSIAGFAGNGTDKNSIAMLTDDLEELEELRGERLQHITAHLPTLVWLILGCGSFLVIAISWLFVPGSRRLGHFLTSSLTALLFLCLLVLYRLDHSLDTYKRDLQQVYKPDISGQPD